MLEWNGYKVGPTPEGVGIYSRTWVSVGQPGAASEPPPQQAITNAANNGSGLIRITSNTHTMVTNDTTNISGIVGTTEANADWTVTRIDANNFDLIGSTFTHAYVSGGTINGTKYTNGAGGMTWANQSPSIKSGLTFGAMSTQIGTILVYDRLVAVGNVTLSSTGNKTINTPALPRYTDGVGVECWIEISTAGSASTPIITLNSYTDNDGNTGQTGAAVTLATTPSANSIYQLSLATADTGVQAVATINVGTSSASMIGNVVLIKPLFRIPVIASVWNERDLVLQLTSLPRIYDGATLGINFINSTSGTAPTIWTQIRAVYG